jgi:hypothetical protein
MLACWHSCRCGLLHVAPQHSGALWRVCRGQPTLAVLGPLQVFCCWGRKLLHPKARHVYMRNSSGPLIHHLKHGLATIAVLSAFFFSFTACRLSACIISICAAGFGIGLGLPHMWCVLDLKGVPLLHQVPSHVHRWCTPSCGCQPGEMMWVVLAGISLHSSDPAT